MVLVRGLDRLDGSAIEGMGDELWSRHAAELQRRFEEQPDGGDGHLQRDGKPPLDPLRRLDLGHLVGHASSINSTAGCL